MHTDSESDGSPTDMTSFNMDPVCPLDPANPTYCLQGNYADWVSDFLQTSGQERLRQDDPRLVADDYTMPDWCFLDDAESRLGRPVPAVEQVEVHASSTPTSTGRSPTD